jgi:mannose/fructose/N-acetylgalactosamine-specific phosphotransferase system component IIB
LDDQDVKSLNQLVAQGILLEARPLPLDEPVDIALYLQRWQEEKESLGDQPR